MGTEIYIAIPFMVPNFNGLFINEKNLKKFLFDIFMFQFQVLIKNILNLCIKKQAFRGWSGWNGIYPAFVYTYLAKTPDICTYTSPTMPG